MFEDYNSCIYDCSVQMLTPDGRRLISRDPEWKRPGITTAAPNVNVSFLKRRPTFAKMQLDQVERLGIPVYWGEKVTLVTEHERTVTVTTSSGKTFQGDICIGAYGVNSVIAGFDAGPNVDIQNSGYAMARVAWERSLIAKGSLASSLLEHVDQRPEFRVYVGRDVHLILFLTPDWVAFGLTHKVGSVIISMLILIRSTHQGVVTGIG
jgi:2-polyprenyl-6-methoxyphenol hydroxylase-like FAD-dependent oxidoreductase